jgi:hypothetical protein
MKNREEVQIEMFGMTQNELDYVRKIAINNMALRTVMMGMLSDAQELSDSDPIKSNQLINRVKYFIDKNL